MREFTRWAALGGMLTLALALLSCEPRRARAHALLATGEPVPEWIRKACCGVSDFHHLTKDQVHLQPDGSWLVDGYKKPIPKGTELPSADGEIYIFYRDFSDGTQSSVYCFFYGFQGM